MNNAIKTDKGQRERIMADILNQPDAFLIIEMINNVLREESLKRTLFRINHLNIKGAEFINGSAITSINSKREQEISTNIQSLLGYYITQSSAGFMFTDTMIAFTRNFYQPNICFYHRNKTEPFPKKLTILPPPDLIVEILSESTKERDEFLKLLDYQAHKIEEYWVIDPEDQTLEQYHLNGNEYKLVLKSNNGVVNSFAATGFQIVIEAIFK